MDGKYPSGTQRTKGALYKPSSHRHARDRVSSAFVVGEKRTISLNLGGVFVESPLHVIT